MAQKRTLVIGDLRGGRNGIDPPLSLPDTQCVEALNVDFFGATLARKRAGAANLAYAWDNTHPLYGVDTPFSATIRALMVQSYWNTTVMVDGSATPKWRQSLTNTFLQCNAMYVTDAATASTDIRGVNFGRKLFVCYDSAVSRLHVIDADNATYLRRVGLGTPAAAPTVADTGAGAYAATLRYYKVAWTTQSSGVTLRRSELSAVRSFTPSGAGTAARVTQPTAPSEGETHWELYGSADGSLYWLIATTAIATTTFDDSTAPSGYSAVTGTAPPAVGENTVPTDWNVIAANDNRLFGAGTYGTNTTPYRVWYTPVRGASDVGDDERVPTGNYIDVTDNNDNFPISGLVGDFYGNVLVFKQSSLWRLVPTGDDEAPYRVVNLSRTVGAVRPELIVQAEDEHGAPAVYFWSDRGPYRLSSGGLEYCGLDLEDYSLVSGCATLGHAVYYRDKHQIWFWIGATSGANPTIRFVYDTRLGLRSANGVRGGWTRNSGRSCQAHCSVIHNGSPLIGYTGTTGIILRCDSGTQDYAENYQAYVKTKPYALAGLGHNCSIGQPHLTAKAGSAVTITLTMDRDYGLETRTSTCLLTASASETRVQRQFEGGDTQGAGVVQFQIGDAAAANNSWQLDALAVPYLVHEER